MFNRREIITEKIDYKIPSCEGDLIEVLVLEILVS